MLRRSLVLVLIATFTASPALASDHSTLALVTEAAVGAATARGTEPTQTSAEANPRLSLNLPREALALAQQQATPDYEAAVARKRSGKRKMYLGLGLMGAGVVITTLDPASSKAGDPFKLIGGLTAAAGGGVFVWGLIGWMDANSDINRLAPQQSPTTSAAFVDLTDRQSVGFAVGRRSMAAYRVRW